MAKMRMATFRIDEFEEFLQTISWLQDCRITWAGEHALELAKTEGIPGEEKISAVRIEPGQPIEPVEMAFIFFSYIKGAYQCALDAEGKGSAYALAAANLLEDRVRRGLAERAKPEGPA